MNSMRFVLSVLRQQGKTAALALQGRSSSLTGTELNAESEYLPDFQAAKATQNMITRPVGFVCKSSAGRVVRLLQPYNSDIYTAEPENLPSQWAFVWSSDPAHALPFVALSTSPYMIGDCCTEEGTTYRSKVDHNVFSPVSYPNGWDAVE